MSRILDFVFLFYRKQNRDLVAPARNATHRRCRRGAPYLSRKIMSVANIFCEDPVFASIINIWAGSSVAERCFCKAEVAGPIPAQSTSPAGSTKIQLAMLANFRDIREMGVRFPHGPHEFCP